MTINEAVLFFFLYSFLGWIYESALVSIREKEWSNRGFLIGPVCPIYGSGAVAAVLVCRNMSAPVTFFVCMIGSAVLEYATAYTLDKLYHASWWDYSHMPFNINGYICLPCSLGFGAAGLVITKFIHPYIAMPIEHMPYVLQELLALILVAVCSSDLTVTATSLSDFAEKVKACEERINRNISEKYDELESSVSDRIAAVKSRVMIPENIRESIIEREIKASDFKLNMIQRNAINGIKKFKNSAWHSENTHRIHKLMIKLSSAAKRTMDDNSRGDGNEADKQ